MREQGQYTKNKVKNRDNKKKIAIYYKKEFIYIYQVLKEYNIIYY